MGWFWASREDRAARFMEIKALLLVTGAGLGIAGMVTEQAWLVWTAMGVIAVGIGLRLISRERDRKES